jgi:hypothetical protein
MLVDLVRVERGRETVVAARALGSGRVLRACCGVGATGAVLALAEVLRAVREGGHTLATVEASGAEAAA